MAYLNFISFQISELVFFYGTNKPRFKCDSLQEFSEHTVYFKHFLQGLALFSTFSTLILISM